MTPASVDAPKPKRLLFVCLGNICRSPAAHAVMEAMVAEAGLDDQIEVDSCGVGDWHVGQLPDSRMRRHGARRGYRVDHHARQFSAADFDRFDWIVGMDDRNCDKLRRLAPDEAARRKVLRMADFLQQHPDTDSIPDPYYGSTRDFELVVELLEDACEGLMQKTSGE